MIHPDPPVLLRALEGALVEWNANRGNPHEGTDAKVHNSWAGWCEKKIAYSVQGSEEEDFTSNALWNFFLGSQAHDFLQQAARNLWDAECEVHHIEENRSGHLDIGIVVPRSRLAIELKTTNGTAFKLAVEGEGPKREHKLQAFLNARDYDADFAVVAYLAKESLSPRYANPLFGKDHDPSRRFYAEWHFPRREYEALAQFEHHRLTWIANNLESAQRFVPGMPVGAAINPKKGRWTLTLNDVTQTGRVWQCDYCQHRPICEKDYETEIAEQA